MSSTHWNIQINIQRVTDTPEEDAVKRFAQGKPPIRKETMQVAEIKLQADTEDEAYAKAYRLLHASRPEPTTAVHQHRASCHGAIGELICEHPQAQG